MKRYGNLFNVLISYDNINEAVIEVCKLNNYTKAANDIMTNKETCIQYLQQLLIERQYTVSNYWHKEIQESGKHRDIFILPIFPDRIIQHALVQILEPIWDKTIIDQSCACRKNRGIDKAVEFTKQYVSKYTYCVKFDIHHFYQSIDHYILKNIIRAKLKDEDILYLLDKIIDSSNIIDGVGIPIGNYISQWFGNLYLGILDRFVKEELHINGYVRYCDDFIIFGDDKEKLNMYINAIRYLVYNVLRLQFSRCDLFPMEKRFVDFLGYQFHKDKSNVYLKMRVRTYKRCMNRLNNITREALPINTARSVYGSYNGIGIRCSGHNAYDNILNFNFTKERIDAYDRILKKSLKEELKC